MFLLQNACIFCRIFFVSLLSLDRLFVTLLLYIQLYINVTGSVGTRGVQGACVVIRFRCRVGTLFGAGCLAKFLGPGILE